MIKILFVCHGNICRSPMGEFILRDMVTKRGDGDKFHIASAGTSTEELGNPVYPPARRKLAEHGISCEGKYAVQIQKKDYENYDFILAADRWNVENMKRMFGGDPQEKIRRLLDYTRNPRDIADPWYSGDFETSYRDIVEGCQAFLDSIDVHSWE